MLPAQKLNKYTEQEIAQMALQKLEMLDISKLAHKKPNQLSGGEKQRVAIARALINSPQIIMCDEPTGNLDKKNSEIVFDIFQRLTKEINQTLLVVTHDTSFAEKTQRIIEMEDGRIVSL
jgi:lipoprotein-releasing system ATP-binding protein